MDEKEKSDEAVVSIRMKRSGADWLDALAGDCRVNRSTAARAVFAEVAADPRIREAVKRRIEIAKSVS